VPKRISISIGLSIAAHAAIALFVIQMAPRLGPLTHDLRASEISIEIDAPEPVRPEPIPEPEPERTEIAAVAPQPTTERVERIERTEPAPRIPSAPEPNPESSSSSGSDSLAIAPNEPPGTDTPTETPAERRERLRTLLDPAAVAGRSWTIEGPGPSTRRGPQSAQESAGSLRPRTEQEVERDLSSGLRQQAMAKTYLSRERFEVRRRPDGTHVYEGHAFTAVIARDGSVTFSDRPGLQTNGVSTQDMRFDLGDLLQRAQGADPYAHERNRFMEETEELRAGLESTAQRERMTAGLRRLRGQLTRIWQDESRSIEQRRRLIFDQWAEIDEGGGDGGAREIIENFVRENLPLGTGHEYSADELRRLNAGRATADRFDPYRS
jgi:hypothetical protein